MRISGLFRIQQVKDYGNDVKHYLMISILVLPALTKDLINNIEPYCQWQKIAS